MGEFKFAVPRLGTAQLKKRNTFSIHFYNAGAPTFGGLSPPPRKLRLWP